MALLSDEDRIYCRPLGRLHSLSSRRRCQDRDLCNPRTGSAARRQSGSESITVIVHFLNIESFSAETPPERQSKPLRGRFILIFVLWNHFILRKRAIFRPHNFLLILRHNTLSFVIGKRNTPLHIIIALLRHSIPPYTSAYPNNSFLKI